MHRVFCATPLDMEEERSAFEEAIGEFNEQRAMAREVLFVPVSLIPNMTDKRAFQRVVRENIEACRYYIQVLGNDWGPPERNFEGDYALAVELAGKEGSTMKAAVVLCRRAGAGLAAGREFEGRGELKAIVEELLGEWLESVAGEGR